MSLFLNLMMESLLMILYVLESVSRERALSVYTCLSITIMATPLSTVSTTLDVSSQSSLMAYVLLQ